MKKIFLFLILLPITYLFGQNNLQNGLVAYFPLNNDVNDYSSLNINGTNYNAVPSQSGNRYYYDFNGINAYIYAGNDDRNITDEITVTAWVNTTSNNLQWIVGHYDYTVDRGFQVVMENGHVQLRGRDGSNTFYILSDPDTINDGNWHFIVGLYDHNRWTLIVDCQIKNYLTTNSYNPSYFVNSQAFSISKYPQLNYGNPLYFTGGIDEIRVYNRILSICDICQVHNKIDDGARITASQVENNINVFPNPANNKVTVTYFTGRQVTLNLFDLKGKFILERKFTNSIDIDTNGLEKGTYLIVIIDKNQKISKKLIIK